MTLQTNEENTGFKVDDLWIADQHVENLRLGCLKVAMTLLDEYIKENTLSPRDESMQIIWEVSDKCFEYCHKK